MCVDDDGGMDGFHLAVEEQASQKFAEALQNREPFWTSAKTAESIPIRHLDSAKIEDHFPGAFQFNRVEFEFVDLSHILSELTVRDNTLRVTLPNLLVDQYVCCVEDTRTDAYIGENFLHAESRRNEPNSIQSDRLYFWPCIDGIIVHC